MVGIQEENVRNHAVWGKFGYTPSVLRSNVHIDSGRTRTRELPREVGTGYQGILYIS